MDYHRLWKEIEQRSSSFTSNYLIKRSFSEFIISDDLINDVFGNLSLEEYSRSMRFLRIFDNYTLESKWIQKVVLNKPPAHTSFSEWIKLQLGTDELFLILNYVDRFSDQMAKKVSNLILPLQQNPDLPCIVCEADFILGKYDQTPLGIHVDNPLGNWHRVLQINLGPGKKKMHFWDKEQLHKLMDGNLKNYFVSKEELRDLVPHATTFEMEPGDALFFSPEEYHIAESDEYSVSLGLVVFNEKMETFQKNALKEYVEDRINETLASQKDDQSSYLILTPSSELPLHKSSWTKKALNEYHYKHLSNNYLRLPPIKKHFPFKTIEELIGKDILINEPFKMIYTSNANEAEGLFIRGRKIMIAKIPGLELFIERLNNGEKVNIKEVVAMFDSKLEKEAILFLIQILYENGGILLSDSNLV